DLIGRFEDANIALIGAPLCEGSLTTGRCDLAPSVIRAALRRLSAFDVESDKDLTALRVRDMGDLDLKLVSPKDGFEPVRNLVRQECARSSLTVLLGGNNAIT